MSNTTKLRLVVAALFAVAATMAASADTVSVRFADLGGQVQNQMYTYPYYLTINNGPQIPMICDDYLHQSNVGDTWQAKITNLGSGNLSNTRFDDLTDYERAAYLLMQINNSNQNEWGNINFAIWKIFDPKLDMGHTPTGTLGPDYWYKLAKTTNLSNIDFSEVYILTPTAKHSSSGDQEFMFLTPEPGSLLLIGGGLIGLFAQRHRIA